MKQQRQHRTLMWRWLALAAVAIAPLWGASSAVLIPPSTTASTDLVDQFFEEENRPAPEAPTAVPWMVLKSEELSGLLTLDKSPYLLNRNSLVPAGKTLTIEAGVEVMVSGGESGLRVAGMVEINGNASRPVLFRSLAEQPTPGAWKGIELLPGSRGQIDGLQLHHARNGLQLNRAQLRMSNSAITTVSGSAIAAQHSTLQLRQVQLGKDSPNGAGLVAANGSRVVLQHGTISGARFGVVAQEYASVILNDATIEENQTGLLLLDSIDLEFRGTLVRDNRVGVASDLDRSAVAKGWAASLGLFGSERYQGLPPEVRDNSLDWTHLPAVNAQQQLSELDLPPALFENHLQVRHKMFKGGVRSDRLELPEVQTFGSVTMGVEYHNVETAKNGGVRPHQIDRDTVEPNALYPNRFQVERFIPYASLYSQSRFGTERLLEVQAHVYHDDWSGWNARPLSVRWESPLSHWTLGHFTKTGSDLVISAVDLLGVEWGIATSTAGAVVTPRFKLDVALGEVRQPLAEGERDPEIFAEVIAPGYGRAQELFVMGRAAFSPVNRMEIAAGFERNWDRVKDPWLRNQLPDQTELERGELDARALFGEWNWTTPKGEWEWRSSLVHGTPDTTQRAWNMAVERWIDEHNILLEADTLRALLKRSARPTQAQLQALLPTMLEQTAAQALREMERSASDIRDSLSENWVGGINPVIDHFGLSWGLDWRRKASALSFDFRFLGRDFYSPGAPDLQPNGRSYGLRWAQGVGNFWNFAFEGRLQVEDASASADHLNFFGFGEGSSSGIGRDSDALELLPLERIRPRTVVEAGVENRWKLPAGLELSMNYGYNYKFRRVHRMLYKDTSSKSGVYADPWFHGSDDSLRYMAQNVGIDTARWNDYRAAIDTLASGYAQQQLTHLWKTELTWRKNRSNITIGSHLRWDRDQSGFDHWYDGDSWSLADTTWGKMGHRPGLSNGFVGSWPLRINWRGERVSNRWTAQLRRRTAAENSYNEWEYSMSNALEWNTIPGRWRLGAEAGALYRTMGYESDNYYLVENSSGSRFRYLEPDGTGGWVPSNVDSYNAIDLDGTVELVGYELANSRRYRDDREEESNLYVSLTSYYAIHSSLQLELETRWDNFLRPDRLEEQWSDLSSNLRLVWEF